MKSSPKITNYPTFSETPYKVPIGNRTQKAEDYPTDVIVHGDDYYAKIPKTNNIVFDPVKYKKIFDEGIDVMLELSEASKVMYLYIMRNLPINKTELYISPEEFKTYGKYNQNNKFVYYQALEGLLAKNIISRRVGSTNVFFINPNFIYNGDRTKFPNTYNLINAKPILSSNNVISEEDIMYNIE